MVRETAGCIQLGLTLEMSTSASTRPFLCNEGMPSLCDKGLSFLYDKGLSSLYDGNGKR